MEKILNKQILILLFASFSPIIFLITRNYFLYSIAQIAYSVLSYLVFYIIFFIIIKLLTKLIEKTRFKVLLNYKIKFMSIDLFLIIISFLMVFIAILIYGLILLKYDHQSNLWSTLIMINFIFFAFGLFIISLKSRFLNLFMLIFFLISLGKLIYMIGKDSLFNDSGIMANQIEDENLIKLKYKPNVYFFLLESMHSEEYIKKEYNSNIDELNFFLLQNGYKIYPKTYANYFPTTMSSLSMFNMKHHYYTVSRGLGDMSREAALTIGNNPLLRIFLNNNYKTAFLDINNSLSYLYRYNSKNINYCKVRWGIEFFLKPLYDLRIFINQANESTYLTYIIKNFFKKFFTSIIKDNDVFENKGIESLKELKQIQKNLNTDQQKMNLYKQEINNSNFNTPVFRLIYGFGCNHIPTYFKIFEEIDNNTKLEYYDSWKETYKLYLLKATDELIEALDYINKNDTNALVVLIGDHGALIKSNLVVSNLPNNKIITEIKNDFNFSLKELTDDAFSIFLSIKFPNYINEQINDSIKLSPVNVFYYVFSVLSNDYSLMEKAPKNDSYYYNFISDKSVYLNVKDGVPLDKWELLDRNDKNIN